MISTTWTDAPAGFSGPGRIGVSRYACSSAVLGGTPVVMAPIAAPIQGSGLPVAARLRPIDERGVNHKSFLQALAVAGAASLSTTTDNNGTTLGIHPPGRPQS
ncbi:hypothetical protein [Blastococcus sp. SYSU DS0617]